MTKNKQKAIHKIHPALEPLAVDIESIHADPKNARTGHALVQIGRSLNEFWQRKPIVVNSRTNAIEAGNGTWQAARDLGWTQIAAVMVDEDASSATGYSLADNLLTDLSFFDPGNLADLLSGVDDPLDIPGVSEDWLKSMGIGDIDLGTGDDSGSDSAGDGENNYSRKIEAPIYEPTGECPNVKELLDNAKAQALIAEIESSELPTDVAEFLIHAAQRHTVFRFDKIAEFYAHANPDVQNLMERSALVIIDFNRAIEEGFVKLTQDVAAQYAKDYPDEG